MSAGDLQDYTRFDFTHGPYAREVLRRGQGPAVSNRSRPRSMLCSTRARVTANTSPAASRFSIKTKLPIRKTENWTKEISTCSAESPASRKTYNTPSRTFDALGWLSLFTACAKIVAGTPGKWT